MTHTLVDAVLEELEQVFSTTPTSVMDELREDLQTRIAVVLEPLQTKLDRLLAENDVLKAKWAVSGEPCLYCGIAADDINQCPSGFPGCGRMDDRLLGEDHG